MNQIVNQFRRIFADNGEGDKDFTEQETKLRIAQKNLWEATDLLRRTSEILTGLIQSKDSIH